MSFSSTATKLIKKFGDTATLREVTQGVYDPQTGSTADTFVDYVVKAVAEEYASNELVAGIINMDDVRLMIDNKYKPTKDWLVIYDNSTWEIINVSRLSTSDTKVYYELQIRSK